MKKISVLLFVALLLPSLTGTVSAQVNKPDAVDLGLSVKWADRNVGANKPEAVGDLLAWGETAPKEDYSWMSYKWVEVSYDQLDYYYTFTRYWPGGTYWTSGYCWDYKDNTPGTDLDKLKAADDVASVKYGVEWHIPTAKEWQELIDNCVFEFTQQSGKNGFLVTSKKNGNYIFLPVTGLAEGTVSAFGSFAKGYYKTPYYDDLDVSLVRGYYWSSDLYTKENDKSRYRSARYFFFNDVGDSGLWYYQRYYGLAVRPVCEK